MMHRWVRLQRHQLALALDRSAHHPPERAAVGEAVRYLYRVWRTRRIGAAEARSLLALRRQVRDRIALLRYAASDEAAERGAYAGLRGALIEYARLARESVALRGAEALRSAVEARARVVQPAERPLPPLEVGPRTGELVANRFAVGPLLIELADLSVYEGETDDGKRVFVHFCAASLDRDALYLGSVFDDRPGVVPGPGLTLEWEGDHGDAIAFVTPHAERFPVGRSWGPCRSPAPT